MLSAAPAKSSGLAGLKLAQLQALASQLGISGGSRMRKGDLVTAISAHRAGTPATKAPAKGAEKTGETISVPGNGTGCCRPLRLKPRRLPPRKAPVPAVAAAAAPAATAS